MKYSNILAFFLIVGTVTAIGYEIRLPEQPTSAERLAGEELQYYLSQCANDITIEDTPAIIHIGESAFARAEGQTRNKFADEEWAVVNFDHNIVIQGGGERGVLWGVYHFLEDQIGVSWLTPEVEYVPPRQHFEFPELDDGGQPAMICRYAGVPDGASEAEQRFIRRNRGTGEEIFGTPILLDHKPLCLTAPETIATIRSNFRDVVMAERSDPLRRIYDLSPGGNSDFCRCPACEAKISSGYNHNDLLLELANTLAHDLAELRPDAIVQCSPDSSEAPQQVKPEANVIVRLHDVDGNEAQPILHADNAPFREQVQQWAQQVDRLFIRTHLRQLVAPEASEYLLPTETAFYDANRVVGYFRQYDEPCADPAALHRYLAFKYFEDPKRQDFESLRQRFLREYFGDAAPMIEQYRRLIQQASAENQAKAWTFGSEFGVRHLNLDTLLKAQAIFEEACRTVNGGPYFDRLLLARVPLDLISGFTLPRYYHNLWVAADRELETLRPEACPLRPEEARQRVNAVWNMISMQGNPALATRLYENFVRYAALPDQIPAPLPFEGRNFIDITPEHFGRDAIAQVLPDPGTDTGYVYKLQLPPTAQPPFIFTVTDRLSQEELLRTEIPSEKLPEDGDYQWFRLSDNFHPGPRCALLWQDAPDFAAGLSDLVNFAGTHPLELWIRFKFTPSTHTALIERIVAVRQPNRKR